MTEDARERILQAAIELRLDRPDSSVTVEAVARRAKCAKGLVAYHFKTKKAVFQAADETISARRFAAWTTALGSPNPQSAIDACWDVITQEAESGVATYAGQLTDWSDSEAFSPVIGRSAVAVLKRAGRTATVAETELADLCGVTLPGFARALAGGADPARLAGAYAGFWVALFALTRAA